MEFYRKKKKVRLWRRKMWWIRYNRKARRANGSHHK